MTTIKKKVVQRVCDVCNYKARDGWQLTRHKYIHIAHNLKCKFCKTPHSNQEEATAHEETCDKCVMCFYCQQRMRNKFILSEHIKRKHVYPAKKPGNHKCPLCSNRFNHSDLLETHLSRDHDVLLERESLTFDNEDDFFKWKTELESSRMCLFSTTRHVRHKGTKYTYFNCHRSGTDRLKPMQSRKRRVKLLGSNKINAYCPARITLHVPLHGKVQVSFVATHVGHDFEVLRLPLAKSYKESLATQMLMKVPLDEILISEREKAKECSKEHLQRSLFLKRHDLFNIARDYGVKKEVVFHQNDATSIQEWIDKNQESDSPWIRYYKCHGDADPACPEIQTNDFILILMNDDQRQSLQEFGKNIVCVDGTCGTNGYGLELTIVLVLNDRMEGLPVASMFSSKSDTGTMTFFFNHVREFCGAISSRVFMSDTTETYFEAWKNIMGTPKLRLFCSWHIDSEWLNHLNELKGGMVLKKGVYQKLKDVQMELDIPTFISSFSRLTDELLSNNETKSFGLYLRNFFSDNTASWAYCYRVRAGLSINTHLDRMHGIFKHLYLEGKKTKRFDKALRDLEILIRDKLFNEFVSFRSEKLSKRVETLKRKHEVFEKEQNIMRAVQVNNREWVVNSSSHFDLYTVYKVQDPCESCYLKCDSCEACAHTFICTCIDNAIKGNMCKHIHKVCSETDVGPFWESSQSIVIEEANDDFVFVSDNSNAEVDVENSNVVQYEVISQPSTSCRNAEEAITTFTNMVKRIKNKEQLTAVNEALSWLSATLSEDQSD